MPMTLAQLLALLPDNTSGAIGADDMRTVTTELYNQGVVAPPVTSVDGETGAVNLTDNYTRLFDVVGGPTGLTANYTAAAGEFVLFDTTAAARTLTLPAAPPNGTQVGVRICTFGAGNFVTVNCGGSDVFNKPGGVTSYVAYLQYVQTTAVFLYDAGFWQPAASNYALSTLDSRYVNETDVVTLAAGQDLQVNAPVGNVQTVQVTDTQHNLWTPTFIRATADDVATNNAALHDDPTLQFPYVANATYDITARILVSGDNTVTTGGQFRSNWRVSGAGTTFDSVGVGPHNTWPGTSGITQGGGVAQTIGGSDNTWGVPQTLGQYAFMFFGTLISSATAGTLFFRWSQKVAVAIATTRYTGSVLIARRLV